MFHKFMVAGLCTRVTESLFEQSIWNIWTLTKISKQYSHLCKKEMAIISSISPGFFFHTGIWSKQSKGSFEIRKALSGIDFQFYFKALSLAFTGFHLQELSSCITSNTKRIQLTFWSDLSSMRHHEAVLLASSLSSSSMSKWDTH